MDGIDLEPLLIRPFPEAKESWRGYILRVAQENALLSPRIMLRYSKVSEDDLRTTFPHINHMISLTNKSEDVLDKIYPVNHKENSYKLLGQPLPKAYLRVNTPAICTECVRELGYVPARWDVVYMSVCHKHKRNLIGHCPHCKGKLRWYRQGLLRCHCGFDLSEVVGATADPEEVNFSELLSLVIESERNVTEHNPIPKQFFEMSLSTLLSVFNTLGQARHNLEDDAMHLKSTTGNRESYHKAVNIFNNWPFEFQNLIRLNELKNRNDELSLRKKHVSLYDSIFKRGYPKSDTGFILDEFIKAAYSSQSLAYVDYRIRRMGSSQEFNKISVGINEAAKTLGVMPSTLRKRIANGSVKAKKYITPNGQERHLIQLDKVEKKLPNNLGELPLREAAAYIGLPVRVIKSLRTSYHYYANHKTEYQTGWAIPDLDDLASRIMNNVVRDLMCDDPISLSKAMLMKFRSEDIKTEILRGMLEGRIKGYGPATKVGDIFLSKLDVINLTDSKRLETSDYLKFRDVTKLTGIDQSCLNFIVKKQIFRTKKVNYITYINREDVEKFNIQFIAISRIASEHSLSPSKLSKRSELNGIHLFKMQRLGGKLQSFIRREDQQKLLDSYFK